MEKPTGEYKSQWKKWVFNDFFSNNDTVRRDTAHYLILYIGIRNEYITFLKVIPSPLTLVGDRVI